MGLGDIHTLHWERGTIVEQLGPLLITCVRSVITDSEAIVVDGIIFQFGVCVHVVLCVCVCVLAKCLSQSKTFVVVPYSKLSLSV